MNETLERHTDGSVWTPCTQESPKRSRTWIVEIPTGGSVSAQVYHPAAEGTDRGQDERWHCPHCGQDWWEEIDG